MTDTVLQIVSRLSYVGLAVAAASLAAVGCGVSKQRVEALEQEVEEIQAARRHTAFDLAQARTRRAYDTASGRAQELMCRQALVNLERGQQAGNRLQAPCYDYLGELRQTISIDSHDELPALKVFEATPAERRYVFEGTTADDSALNLRTWVHRHAEFHDISIATYHAETRPTADAETPHRKRLLTIELEGVDVSNLTGFLADLSTSTQPAFVSSIRVPDSKDLGEMDAVVELRTFRALN